jgi:hypothetical protein
MTVQFMITVEARPHDELVEWPVEEWRAMTPAQRREALDDAVEVAVANAGGAGYRILSGATDSDLEG